MSANIYYQAVTGTEIPIGAPSSFLAIVRRFTGAEGPWVFEHNDVAGLNGVLAALEDRDHANAIRTILNAIAEHAVVRVWAEY